MSEFFAGGRRGRPGLALFLNAGDPPLEVLTELVPMLDRSGVDCLELAVPFPDSPTDGPVIRRSAERALRGGTGLDQTLDFVRTVRGRLDRLKIALLVDWSHTVRPVGVERLSRAAVEAGVDGLLVHGSPPRQRPHLQEEIVRAGLPLITTCYGDSAPDVVRSAALTAGGYVYLVAHRERSGSPAGSGYRQLAPVVADLKRLSTKPVAVGFGVRSAADLTAIGETGADAAVVGSAAVARVERSLAENRDPTVDLQDFVQELYEPERLTEGRRNDH